MKCDSNPHWIFWVKFLHNKNIIKIKCEVFGLINNYFPFTADNLLLGMHFSLSHTSPSIFFLFYKFSSYGWFLQLNNQIKKILERDFICKVCFCFGEQAYDFESLVWRSWSIGTMFPPAKMWLAATRAGFKFYSGHYKNTDSIQKPGKIILTLLLLNELIF